MERHRSRKLDQCHLASKTPLVLGVSLLVGLLGLVACNSGSKFTPVSLDRSPEEYRSSYWTLNSTVQMEKLPTGLRCIVKGNLDPGQTPYGGIMVPADGAKGLRLDMAFTDPESIVQVFVDGFNSQNERIIRWQTDEWPKLRRDRLTYVFLPQQDFEQFKPVASQGSGQIAMFHVFLHVKQGALATFDLYRVELAK